MKVDSTTRFWLASFGVGSVMTAFAILGMTVGLNWQSPARVIPVNASTAATSETMCAATGRVDEEMEGLFTLDALTGDLQCAVINSQTAKFAGLFRTNVVNDLGLDATKKPSYLLLTGNAAFRATTGNSRPADCVAYVVDSTSGRFAAYGLGWNRNISARGAQQSGALVLLDKGTARNVVIRD
ncbi:hypothetical protein DTL21_18475 [Bremerella cremea]|uniref:Uncharacterized protein n=1 Tax=Blastopirellula marina TaxID=124 RepID=A0A2S8FJ80_9BACT|nr:MULTISPECIES: hypothetical protein [Pirellulaceae]PQO32216.1 hypothetical protein C5Y83_18460 [Blastopirellula marina]RCS45282.1 hypothetical protein DTL21_18475 [Bremerella cremea]